MVIGGSRSLGLILKPVYQDQFGYGKGNCVWACVASLFDIPLDDLRLPAPTDEELSAWFEEQLPDLELHHRDMAVDYRVIEGYPYVEGVGTGRWTYDLPKKWTCPTRGYWMASIHSPGLMTPVESHYYPMPGMHMVVMKGRKLVHDPNPNYEVPYEPEIVEQHWWTKRVDTR